MESLLSRIFNDFESEDYEASQVEAYKRNEALKAHENELVFIRTAFEDAVCLKYNVDTREEALKYAEEAYQFDNQETC
ncbi:MAG: hypothetical protein LBL79_08495 [Prevotella sp.]|jgi:hypothetical protein|nr:hypothetical protein [Prevotella sp.]